MSIRYQGPVVAFLNEAFGFIFSEELGRRVFFHVTDFNGPNPAIGDLVEFELGRSKTPGKPDQAFNVIPLKVAPPQKSEVRS